jgi:hypothetical protein
LSFYRHGWLAFHRRIQAAKAALMVDTSQTLPKSLIRQAEEIMEYCDSAREYLRQHQQDHFLHIDLSGVEEAGRRLLRPICLAHSASLTV